ncbi:hypothetical protein DFR70_10455 [Nocardia tenerifensis]|uniref:Uncharacterized protein n=1 Tax=Nocardia tenerifensis TaxID=228006 RepID=A0A318K0D5_9NOCA|nr:hypothetical protein DFR70_10455 [Nocardia tenerifensis]
MSQGPSATGGLASSKRWPPGWWPAAAALVAVLIIVAIVVVAQTNSDTAGAGAKSSTVDRPADTTPVSAVWSIPKSFLGQWRGGANDGSRGFEVELTVKPGKNSEELVAWSQTEKTSGNRCERVGRVVTVDETELTLAVRPIGGADCGDDGKPSAIQLQPDGSMLYRAGASTGTLHRP